MSSFELKSYIILWSISLTASSGSFCVHPREDSSGVVAGGTHLDEGGSQHAVHLGLDQLLVVHSEDWLPPVHLLDGLYTGELGG